jgi:hypothetical protein
MTTTDTKSVTQNWNKPAYVAFVLVGLVFLYAQDLSQAVIFLGIALVFDPFNIETAFQKRPLYQRVWLMVHLVLVFTLFALMLSGK